MSVAMVGAGQLARMTHQAAIGLGVELHVLADGDGDSAVRAGAAYTIGSAASLDDLRALADGADVLTFDHEGVPPEHLAALEAEGVRLAPGAAAKLLAQDKLVARERLRELGFPVPPFALARTRADVEAFGAVHGWPLIAKAPRGGYDGRGVQVLGEPCEPEAPLLLEPRLKLGCELAVLVARRPSGAAVAYPVVETIQRDGMCREVLVPAPVRPELAAEASELALRLVEAIGATGVIAVELFVTRDGLLVNELALRPHNSGHYTIEGCVTSQFEQHLRAVLDLPLGSPSLSAPAVATVNVVGPADGSDPAERLAGALAVPGAHVHLYGKAARAGRKLGHVTACDDDVERARATAALAAARLEGRA